VRQGNTSADAYKPERHAEIGGRADYADHREPDGPREPRLL
jgi:hypothetical protein